MSNQISLSELAEKVGFPAGSRVSVGEVAERIGYTKKPIQLSELAEKVEEFLKRQGKKEQ